MDTFDDDGEDVCDLSAGPGAAVIAAGATVTVADDIALKLATAAAATVAGL